MLLLGKNLSKVEHFCSHVGWRFSAFEVNITSMALGAIREKKESGFLTAQKEQPM